MSDDNKTNAKTITLKKFKPEGYRFWVSAVSSTLQVHNCLDIVLGREPNPTPADGNISSTIRKAIASWESRHARAREALLNALEDAELIKAHQLQNANEIWNRLADEYGTISDLKYAKAEADLRSLTKQSNTTMKEHINNFSKFKEARDFDAPAEIPPLSIAQSISPFSTL
jgi:gag-polypeptide of LTR copia-type